MADLGNTFSELLPYYGVEVVRGAKIEPTFSWLAQFLFRGTGEFESSAQLVMKSILDRGSRDSLRVLVSTISPDRKEE